MPAHSDNVNLLKLSYKQNSSRCCIRKSVMFKHGKTNKLSNSKMGFTILRVFTIICVHLFNKRITQISRCLPWDWLTHYKKLNYYRFYWYAKFHWRNTSRDLRILKYKLCHWHVSNTLFHATVQWHPERFHASIQDDLEPMLWNCRQQNHPNWYPFTTFKQDLCQPSRACQYLILKWNNLFSCVSKVCALCFLHLD